MQRTLSGKYNLNSLPRNYLLHRNTYAGQIIPTASSYRTHQTLFKDRVRARPYGRLLQTEMRQGIRGPALFSAKDGFIP